MRIFKGSVRFEWRVERSRDPQSRRPLDRRFSTTLEAARGERKWQALLLGCLALAGCSERTDEAAGGTTPAAAAEQGRVICATGGATDFGRDCTIERVATAEGLALTIRNPDGGFRKLLVTGDGRGVIAADGAEPARVTVTGDREIEVAVAGDRYRLPATVKGQPLRP